MEKLGCLCSSPNAICPSLLTRPVTRTAHRNKRKPSNRDRHRHRRHTQAGCKKPCVLWQDTSSLIPLSVVLTCFIHRSCHRYLYPHVVYDRHFRNCSIETLSYRDAVNPSASKQRSTNSIPNVTRLSSFSFIPRWSFLKSIILPVDGLSPKRRSMTNAKIAKNPSCCMCFGGSFVFFKGWLGFHSIARLFDFWSVRVKVGRQTYTAS